MLHGGVGDKMAAPTTEHEIHNATERVVAHHLLSNTVLLLAHVDVRREARRCSIGNACSNNQARHVPCLLCCLEHCPAGLVVRCDRDGAVVALLRAREGGCAGGGVGDEAG